MRHGSNPQPSARWRVAVCLAGMTVGAVAQPAFKLAEVPVFSDLHNPFVSTGVAAINRSGQMAASMSTTYGGGTAYLCSKTACQDIGAPACFKSGASASDINDAGFVAGTNPYAYEGCKFRGFISNGVAGDSVGPFKEGPCDGCDLSSFAYGINNLGQVVGQGETAEGPYRAFIWQDGVMQKLGTLGGGESKAVAINDEGVVVGDSATAGGAVHAFMYRNGKMRDLGTLGGTQSLASDINHARQVVGCSRVAGDARTEAFIFDNGTMTALPGLGGSDACAHGIDKHGQVVGTSRIAGDGEYHAFLFDGTTLIDLNDTLSAADRARWLVTSANDINKRGQIAARGTHKVYAVERALLLTPRDPREEANR